MQQSQNNLVKAVEERCCFDDYQARVLELYRDEIEIWCMLESIESSPAN